MLNKIERYILESKDEWKQVRKGLFTGSRISEIIPGERREMTEQELVEYKKANPKSTAKTIVDPYGISDGAETYILDLVQNIEGAPEDDIQTFEMLHGIETEPFAVQEYCERYGYDLNADNVIYTSQGGIVFYVGDNLIGATPDLIILGEKIVQIKCPKSKTHLKYLLKVNEDNFKESLPNYYWQMQTEMMLAQVEKAEFVTFDNRYPRKAMQMKTIHVWPNKSDQKFVIEKAKICEARKQELLTTLPK